MQKHMGNPAAAVVGIQAVKETKSFVQDNLLVIGGTILAVWAYFKLPGYLQRKRAERYARQHIGHPAVTAAAIIHESFTRMSLNTGFLSYLLPEFDLFTDEAALLQIASKIDNIQQVAKAYAILFGRDLFTDTLNGLSTSELNTFYNAINAPSHNSDPQINTHYLIGDTLYSAKKTNIQVPKVEKQSDDSWLTTSELYGNFSHKNQIGKIVATDIYEPENKRYYIVEECAIWGYWCDYGIVWSDQVTNQKM